MQRIRSDTTADPDRGEGMIGTWDIEVTLRNCATGASIVTRHAVNRFSIGGTLIETEGCVPSGSGSQGEGTWRHIGGQSYAAELRFFRVNQEGVVAETRKVIRQLEMSLDGGQFTGTARIERFDKNDKLILVECATERAKRF